MNLIKLNPFKKLMLVVLSWFVHSVYNVEVHAWHIGSKVTTVTNMSEFQRVPYGDDDWAKCAGWDEDAGNLYYIFPLDPTLVGAIYVYNSSTKKYGVVGGSGVLCLTAEEFNGIQAFFGNAGQNWGNCMALACNNGQKVSCGAQATGNNYLTGWMFPVLLTSQNLAYGSQYTEGSGFSAAFSMAYAQGSVLIPNAGNTYASGCRLLPKYYIADSTTSAPSTATESTVATFLSTIIKSCPAGYYCPGGSYIGSGMNSRTLNTGRKSCPAGNYCPAGVSTYTSCGRGYYADSEASSCTQCASQYGVYGTTAGMATPAASSCFMPSDTTLNDGTGAFAFISSCYYTS